MRTPQNIEDDFAQFYQEIHGQEQSSPHDSPGEAQMVESVDSRTKPYPWQLRLLREIVGTGRWPDQISAPTGAGKTSVIDIHVYLNALAGESQGNPEYDSDLTRRLNAVPRRLALLAPRRGLVDDQSDISTMIQEKVHTGVSPVMTRVREGLLTRAGAAVLGETTAPPALLVDTVRGGMNRRRFLEDDAWQTHPSYCALIHMTPDMFGSALLFRHYGAGVKRRPQDAGLLSVDTVAVVDEGHLQRQLLLTARRVAILDGLATERMGRPSLQVVATTATPDRDGPQENVVEVNLEDLAADPRLSRRLLATKSVELVRLSAPLGTRAGTEEAVRLLLELGKKAEDEFALTGESGGNVPAVGFITNTVQAALAVTARLREALGVEDENLVFSVVGRMRPVDRMLDLERWPGVLTPPGNPNIRFVVSTQVLEVGVDLDLYALLTELASPTALAQRAGRVNRRGLWRSSPVLVLEDFSGRAGPYSDSEREQGREWLASLGGDISPWAVHLHPAPTSELRRRALQRLETWDVDFFSSTSERLIADRRGSGVELWTRDAFDEGPEAAIIVRGLPPDDIMAADAIRLMPPEELEMLPGGLSATRAALSKHLKSCATPDAFRRYFVWDPLEKRAKICRPPSEETPDTPLVAPGSTIVVDNSASLFTAGVLVEAGTERLPDRWFEAQQTRARSSGRTALLRPTLAEANTPDSAALWMEPYVVLPPAQSDRIIDILSSDESLSSGAQQPDEANAGDRESNLQKQLREILDETGAIIGENADELILEAVTDDVAEPHRAIIVATAITWDGAEEAYEAGSRKPMLLADHNRQVATRARQLAEIQGLPKALGEALEIAGIFHDRGKEDLRFQAVLRLRQTLQPGAEAWAKSRRRSKRREEQIRSMYNLVGWRHEQLSAAFAEAELPPMPHRDLIVRLVGTSHGRGRSMFDDDASRLLHELSGVRLDVKEEARSLYDDGMWESIIERTNRSYGQWSSAYLEALLRAADAMVSAEGKGS